MVVSGSLGGVMVSILAWNAGYVGLIPTFMHNISNFQHTHDTGCGDHDSVQAIIVEPTLCTYMYVR